MHFHLTNILFSLNKVLLMFMGYGFVAEREAKKHYNSWLCCRILFNRDGDILLDNGNQARDRI